MNSDSGLLVQYRALIPGPLFLSCGVLSYTLCGSREHVLAAILRGLPLIRRYGLIMLLFGDRTHCASLVVEAGKGVGGEFVTLGLLPQSQRPWLDSTADLR